MKSNSKTLWELFVTFFKIGAFTFGGGYAMIPLIQRETVENKKWITDDDILEVVAIAESTPGPIAINSSTFVGYRVAGFWGAFFGTLGLVVPSFAIILIISYVLRAFQDNQIVRFAFQGIRAGVLALIIKALWTMYKKVKKDAVAYMVMAVAFILTAVLDVNMLIALITCACIGLFSSILAKRRMEK